MAGFSQRERRKGFIRETVVFLLSLSILLGLGARGGDLFAKEKKDLASRSLSLSKFPGLSKKISIDLKGMDIVELLRYLAVKGELNIVTSPGISGKVNLLLSNVSLADLLEIVLATNNLAYEVKGNIIKVMKAEEYEALYGEKFYDQRKVETVHLKYASVNNISAVLANIKSNIGRIISDVRTGTLVLIDTPQKIEQMKEIIKKTDQPAVSKAFKLEYAKVEEIKDKINAVLTPNVGSLQIDARTNQLIVSDLPYKLEKVEELIKTFDKREKEVFIEAKIVQVSLSDEFKWGIDWDRLTWTGNKGYSFLTQSHFPIDMGSYGKLTVDTAKTNDLDIILSALQSVGETKIISNPHLAVLDGHEAKIVVAKKQPYAITTTTLSEGQSTTATEITFVDIGVSLSVTPTINEEGFITMDIKPEVSEFVEYYEYGTTPTKVPVVESRNAETTVTVKDGVTVIIAGLIKEGKVKNVSKVPLLGDIPILGNLFKSISDQVVRTETIIFLTPRIISGEESFLLERDKERPMLKKIKE